MSSIELFYPWNSKKEAVYNNVILRLFIDRPVWGSQPFSHTDTRTSNLAFDILTCRDLAHEELPWSILSPISLLIHDLP